MATTASARPWPVPASSEQMDIDDDTETSESESSVDYEQLLESAKLEKESEEPPKPRQQRKKGPRPRKAQFEDGDYMILKLKNFDPQLRAGLIAQLDGMVATDVNSSWAIIPTHLVRVSQTPEEAREAKRLYRQWYDNQPENKAARQAKDQTKEEIERRKEYTARKEVKERKAAMTKARQAAAKRFRTDYPEEYKKLQIANLGDQPLKPPRTRIVKKPVNETISVETDTERPEEMQRALKRVVRPHTNVQQPQLKKAAINSE